METTAEEPRTGLEDASIPAASEENGAGVGVVDEKIVNARDDTRIVFL